MPDLHAPRAALHLVTHPEIPLDNRALVHGLIAGERWATDLVWEQHAPMVFRLLERAVGPHGEAEDLLQDVFLRVYARVHTLKEPNALRSFIYSVAIRMLKWELRRRRVRSFWALSASDELPEIPTPGADNESRQLLERFYRILEQINADERTIYVLRYLEGLTIGEMAEAMMVSRATIKRRVSRASERVSRLVAADAALVEYLSSSKGVHADES